MKKTLFSRRPLLDGSPLFSMQVKQVHLAFLLGVGFYSVFFGRGFKGAFVGGNHWGNQSLVRAIFRSGPKNMGSLKTIVSLRGSVFPYFLSLFFFCQPVWCQQICSLKSLTSDCRFDVHDGVVELEHGNFVIDDRYFTLPNPQEQAFENSDSFRRQGLVLEEWRRFLFYEFGDIWNYDFLLIVMKVEFLEAFEKDPNLINTPLCWPIEKKQSSVCAPQALSRVQREKILRFSTRASSLRDFGAQATLFSRRWHEAQKGAKGLLFERLIREQNRRFESQKTETDFLVEKVRQTLLQRLLRGRDREDLTPPEKRMIERVQSVTLERLSEQEDRAQCGFMPNGFYHPQTNSFISCRSNSTLNRLERIISLAHEMSHAIDPCNFYWNIEAREAEKIPYPLEEKGLCLAEKYDLTAPSNPDYRLLLERKKKIIERIIETPWPPSKTNEGCFQDNQLIEMIPDYLMVQVVAQLVQEGFLIKEEFVGPSWQKYLACRERADFQKASPAFMGQRVFESHPVSLDRFRLFYDQPTFRDFLGCRSDRKSEGSVDGLADDTEARDCGDL